MDSSTARQWTSVTTSSRHASWHSLIAHWAPPTTARPSSQPSSAHQPSGRSDGLTVLVLARRSGCERVSQPAAGESTHQMDEVTENQAAHVHRAEYLMT